MLDTFFGIALAMPCGLVWMLPNLSLRQSMKVWALFLKSKRCGLVLRIYIYICMPMASL